MTPTMLVLLGLAAVAVILALIIKAKAHPFLALLVVSAAVALIAGIPLDKVVPTLTAGMGKTLGSVAIIVTLGAMMGRIIEVSGGADALAKTMLDKFGPKRAPLALGVASFIFGIPVFVDVALIVLIPIILSVGRRLQGNMLTYALPTVMALLTMHVVMPPHPGIVGGAELMGANVGMVLMVAIIPAIVMWLTAQFTIPFFTKRVFSPVPMIDPLAQAEMQATGVVEDSDNPNTQSFPVIKNPPKTSTVIALIVFPLLLIMSSTVSAMILPKENGLRTFLGFIGASPMALLLGVLLCMFILGYKRGWGLAQTEDVINSSLPPVAAVILITGAGGTFGHVLSETGVATAVADMLAASGLHILFLAWLMSALIRAAQGSATVATLTTAPLIAPLAVNMALNPMQIALVTVTIGIGSMALSHVNDSLFWVWSRYNKIEVSTGLKSYSIITTYTSLVGFLVALAMWPLVGMMG